jgi:hypothetical protein
MRTGKSGSGVIRLRDQFRSELENARIVSALHRSEVAWALIHANATAVVVTSELGMIPGVEAFGAKLKATPSILTD